MEVAGRGEPASPASGVPQWSRVWKMACLRCVCAAVSSEDDCQLLLNAEDKIPKSQVVIRSFEMTLNLKLS